MYIYIIIYRYISISYSVFSNYIYITFSIVCIYIYIFIYLCGYIYWYILICLHPGRAFLPTSPTVRFKYPKTSNNWCQATYLNNRVMHQCNCFTPVALILISEVNIFIPSGVPSSFKTSSMLLKKAHIGMTWRNISTLSACCIFGSTSMVL